MDLEASHRLDEQLLFWFKFLDLHFLASLQHGDKQFRQFCDFKQWHQADGNQRPEPAQTGPTMRTRSFVFLTDGHHQKPASGQAGWLGRISGRTVDQLVGFVRSGQPNRVGADLNQSSAEWPAYDTLNRRTHRPDLEAASGSLSPANLSDSLSLHLDLIPYLIHFAQHQQANNSSLEPVELSSCLADLDASLKDFKLSSVSQQQLFRFQNEAHCLANATLRLRNHLRSSASFDLEPLWLRLNNLSAGSSKLLALSKGQQQRSALSARNLVGLYQDGGLTSELDPEQILAQASSNSSMILVPFDPIIRVGPFQGRGTNQTTSGNFRLGSLLARTYERATSNVVTLAVTCGLLLLTLNVVVFVAIIFRSALANIRRRRAELASMTSNGHLVLFPGGELGTHESVRVDDGEAALSDLPPSLFAPDDHIDHSSQRLASAFKGRNACSVRPAKSIKFDLSGLESRTAQQLDHRTTIGDSAELACSGFMAADPLVGGHRLANHPQGCAHNHLLDSFPSLAAESTLEDQLMGEDRYFARAEQLQGATAKQQVVCPNHGNTNGSLTSPFASQSTSGSSATVYVPANREDGHLGAAESAYSLLLNVQNLSHSAASPGSLSATLSSTPVQLDHHQHPPPPPPPPPPHPHHHHHHHHIVGTNQHCHGHVNQLCQDSSAGHSLAPLSPPVELLNSSSSTISWIYPVDEHHQDQQLPAATLNSRLFVVPMGAASGDPADGLLDQDQAVYLIEEKQNER